METNKTKFAVIAATVIVILCMAFIIKRQHDSIKSQEAMMEKTMVEFRELKDGSVRSQAQYTKDLEAWAKQNKIDLAPIQKDIADLDAKMIGISTLLTSTPGYKGTNLSSSSQVPRPSGPGPQIITCPPGGSVECPDTFGYGSNAQVLKLGEPFSNGTSIPFGQAEFRAWESKPWSLEVYPRTYSVTTVLGQDEDGRHYTYHKFAIQTNGQTYPVKIDESKFVEELPESEFRFSPRLYLGVDVGAQVYPLPNAEVAPNIQVALFSLGRTKIQPDFTFVGLGVSYESQAQTMGVMLTPFSYNIGNHIPLVDNMYVGPSVSVNMTGGVTVAGGIRVGL